MAIAAYIPSCLNTTTILIKQVSTLRMFVLTYLRGEENKFNVGKKPETSIKVTMMIIMQLL